MACFNRLLDSIFPPRCVLCGKVSENRALCCHACTQKEPPFVMPVQVGDGTDTRPWKALYCAHRYDGNVRQALGRFKFHGDMRAGEYFGSVMSKLVTEAATPLPFTVIVPVPLPEERQRMRGYNQAEILAQHVAAATGLPVLPHALLRTGTLAQHQLTSRFRHRAADATFCAGSTALTGAHVLLVDDVVTTGNTAAVCCRLLLDMGAQNVTVLAAAGWTGKV